MTYIFLEWRIEKDLAETAEQPDVTHQTRKRLLQQQKNSSALFLAHTVTVRADCLWVSKIGTARAN